jgi:hypothetical protein
MITFEVVLCLIGFVVLASCYLFNSKVYRTFKLHHLNLILLYRKIVNVHRFPSLLTDTQYFQIVYKHTKRQMAAQQLAGTYVRNLVFWGRARGIVSEKFNCTDTDQTLSSVADMRSSRNLNFDISVASVGCVLDLLSNKWFSLL